MLHASSEPGPSKDMDAKLVLQAPAHADAVSSSAYVQQTYDGLAIATEAGQAAASANAAVSSNILIGMAYNPLEMTELEFLRGLGPKSQMRMLLKFWELVADQILLTKPA